MNNPKLTKKILIIEDNLDYSQLLERVLTKAGYVVILMSHPKGAHEKAKSEKVDVLILDIMLPGDSGFSVLHDFKNDELTKKIPVFCLTNLPEEVGREKALELGAYCYLTKANYSIYDIVKRVDYYFQEEESPASGR